MSWPTGTCHVDSRPTCPMPCRGRRGGGRFGGGSVRDEFGRQRFGPKQNKSSQKSEEHGAIEMNPKGDAQSHQQNQAREQLAGSIS